MQQQCWDQPNDAICFLNKKNAKVSFSSSQGTIISPKEIKSNTYAKNVWEANCIESRK